MIAYSTLTAFLPLARYSRDSSSFWNRYNSDFRRIVELSKKFEEDIKKLNPYFLFDEKILEVLPKEKKKPDKKEDPKRETRALEAIKQRIAEITFSDSPRDIKERPKFYTIFKLTENSLPEGRFKGALITRTKQELYEFKTRNTEESYLRSYNLIFIVMPLLGLVEGSLVNDWLAYKQRHKR